MLKFNRQVYKDKVYACFMGKNIGGTLGGPYEGRREVLNITGFSTEAGAPLPNDDLDLQLVWLKAVQENNLRDLTAQMLGQYWLDRIVAYWNEYGICKANMRNGILPPMSGEWNNPYWRDSNGAWIRTEIWACLSPGNIPNACRLAYNDGCVDHGHGEGTLAAIFVAALESAAFVEKDIRKIIEVGLSQIPESCRVARSVRIAMECYDSGLDWLTARNRVNQDSADLGWFMAPANVAYVIIGLLYGEGDFKKTMLTAVNCGDDTDCTAATAGSIMGILYGTEGLPKDWCCHIGDEIVTVSLNRAIAWDPYPFPATLTLLTDQIVAEAERDAHQKFKHFQFTDEPEDGTNELILEENQKFNFEYELMAQSGYSYAVKNSLMEAIVDFGKPPVLSEGETLTFKLLFRSARYLSTARTAVIRWIVPEGYTVSGDGMVMVSPVRCSADERKFHGEGNYRVTVQGNLLPKATLLAEIQINESVTPLYLPVTVMSK